jgi:fucose 4-O-acetylase-like acetyltransferase
MQSPSAVLAREAVAPEAVKKKRFRATTEAKRLGWVDFARGLAMLLVVYRHSIVGIQRSGLSIPPAVYYIQEFVYNFRMPVFFLLSGFFLALGLKKYSVSTLVTKKLYTLLYPYILWSVILITLQIVMSQYTNSVRTISDYRLILTQPRQIDHMWYLLALFNTSVLFLFLYTRLRKFIIIHLALALSLHFLCFLFQDFSFFSDLCYYYIYLVLGAILADKLIYLESLSTKKLFGGLLVVLPFFLLGQYFWLSKQPEVVGLALPFLVITLIACSFFYLTCKLLFSGGIALWLTEIGRNSLQIYILHLLLISSFRIMLIQVFSVTNIYLVLGGSMILGIIGPILIYRVLQHWGCWFLFSLEKPKNR